MTAPISRSGSGQSRAPSGSHSDENCDTRCLAPRSRIGSRTNIAADPVAQIVHSHDGRLAPLIPLRVERMVASPYGFLRGATIVMAHDFSRLQATGITPVICGDAHLGNFGFYASPERDLVLDLNDFDEAHPGPWEWDLRRLVVSLWIAGRQNGTTEARCGDSVMACVASYRETIRFLANQPLLWRSFQRLNVGGLHTAVKEKSLRREIARTVTVARTRTSDRALPRFTAAGSAGRQIVDRPPLITRVTGQSAAADRDGPSTITSSRWRPTGGVLSPATRWSMSHTKSLASAASVCAATSRCSRGAARTMSFSCS